MRKVKIALLLIITFIHLNIIAQCLSCDAQNFIILNRPYEINKNKIYEDSLYFPDSVVKFVKYKKVYDYYINKTIVENDNRKQVFQYLTFKQINKEDTLAFSLGSMNVDSCEFKTEFKIMFIENYKWYTDIGKSYIETRGAEYYLHTPIVISFFFTIYSKKYVIISVNEHISGSPHYENFTYLLKRKRNRFKIVEIESTRR